MTIDQDQELIVAEFSQLSDWADRYKKIIRLGQELPPLSDSLRVEANLVKGCQSKVWLWAQLNDGRIEFVADSDAAIVKGLIALLIRVYSQRTPAEILNSQPEFIQKLGLNVNLSQSRANGLVSMIKQIKYFALAFSQVTEKPS